MKKRYIFEMLLVVFGGLQGQTNLKKAITSEIGISLSSSGKTINTFGLNGRYFLGNNLAAIIGVSGNQSKVSRSFMEDDKKQGEEGTYTSFNSNLNLNGGVQYHFKQREKLSPFVGCNLLGSIIKNKYNGVNANSQTYTANRSITSVNGSNALSFYLNTGFDYWFKSNIYIGVNYSPFSIIYTKIGEQEIKTVTNGNESVTFYPAYTDFKFNFNSTVGDIRLGWRFN